MFKKTKKIILICFCIFVSVTLLTCSVSAESRNDVVEFDLTGLQIKYLNGSGAELTAWRSLTPNKFSSPFGGTFFGARYDGDTVLSAMQWNSNWYFNNNINFKKGVKYTISGYFCVPWDKLVTSDNYFNFYKIQVKLCDTNRNTIYDLNTDNSNTQSAWIKKVIPYFNVDFGFYPISFSFVPPNDIKGYFFNVFLTYGLLVEPNSRGNFGFSDLTLSYEYDGSQAIIDNQNQNTQDIIDNQNDNTDKQIQADKELYEQEKQEIDSSGNDSIDGVTEAIPDDSEGFISAINQLSSCLVSSSNQARWNFPRVYLPRIPNVIDKEVELIPATKIDFNFWINKIPPTIMTIVRTLCTLALLIFCFKELYSTISYVMTLKKGE